MLRHALRRLLWIVPILIGVTLASFALLSYVPDPADDPAVVATLAPEEVGELRRSRFLDLPRFFNEHPVDVVGRVDDALSRLGSEAKGNNEGQRELVRLGGAALPYLLPRLDALDPVARARVAVALLPVAERMGIASAQAGDPALAVAFWNRFWADRGIDFRSANARRAARRLSAHGTSTREADLIELDTFALDQIMAALDELVPAARAPTPDIDIEPIRRLVVAAAHVTERDDTISEQASITDALACLRRWREWWLVHHTDYVAQSGASRFLAMLIDTQYARWAEKVVLLGFGTGDGEAPLWEKLRDRAPPTVTIVVSAVLLAYAMALFLAVLGALRPRSSLDLWILASSLLVFAVPTACLAVVLARRGHSDLLLAVIVLAVGLLVSPLGQVRAVLHEIRRRDYIRSARALGMGPVQIAVHHALRNAALPLVALASVELPTAFGGAFVVEKAFGISGLGEETVRAVQTHDVAWLVGLAFVSALAVTLTSIAADFAVAALDPRLSNAALRHRSNLA
jgi:ABC-type dipeptide/oligopeptide/nickel transport system permease component